MKHIDNLVIGDPVEGLSLHGLGIGKEETTVHVSLEQAAVLEFFLPRILVHVGLFKSTSEIKRVNKDRLNSKKIKDPLSRDLWRTLDKPEFTFFKVGKKVFTLIVGEIQPDE